MPLTPGRSNKVVSKNIKELEHTGGRPHNQIVAIAMSEAGRAKARSASLKRRIKTNGD
jgi:hypothetical protein